MKNFYVIGLGASAGGLPALIDFFKHTTENPNVAFVVVTHLTRGYRSQMDMILAKYSIAPVIRVTENMRVVPGHVYVLAENRTMTIQDGILQVELRDPSPQNWSVDIFLNALACDFKEKSVGIIFSGGGDDGTLGAEAITSEGGKVMVQDPGTAAVQSMPVSVIRYDHPVAVMEPAALAGLINRM